MSRKQLLQSRPVHQVLLQGFGTKKFLESGRKKRSLRLTKKSCRVGKSFHVEEWLVNQTDGLMHLPLLHLNTESSEDRYLNKKAL